MKNETKRILVGKGKIIHFQTIFLMWILLLFQLNVMAQERTISGTVTGTDGTPLIGVSVVAKGTTAGTLTDADGKFSFPAPSTAQTLVFSFVGMETREIPITSQSVYDVTLSQSTIGLDEVVVIGYGTQRKSDLTGSVVRVNMDQKSSVANVTLSAALKGVTAGVNVGGEGTAGSTPDLSIRGKTSLSATDNPLIVLDGIIYNGYISDINISDVESIDILKDASAAAVYGSRSANGVMIITTKKGKSEKPLFSVNAYYGFQDFTNTPLKVMNGDEFAIRLADFYYQQSLYAWYAKKPTSPTDQGGKPASPDINDRDYLSTLIRTQEEKENYLAHRYVDWMKEIEQSAPIQNYDISVSGRTARSNYYLSGSYTDQKGRLMGDKFNRTTIHTNLENKITDWMTIGINSSYSYRDYSGVEASVSTAMDASPLVSIKTPQGTYPIELAKETGHPLGNTICDNPDYRRSLFMMGYAKIEVPKIKGLTYDFNYSNTLFTNRNAIFYPTTTNTGNTNKGYAVKNYSEDISWIFNNILTYSRVFANNHSVNATLLYSREQRKGENSQLTASGFDNEVLGYNAMELGSIPAVNTGGWEENSVAYMARLNYSFKSRYLLTATIRRDGFSGFGANRKTATFPSLSLGWVISDEPFMKDLEVINFLKLRTSVGKNGNQGIGRYSSFSKMSTTQYGTSAINNVSYVFGSSTAVGIIPSSLGNADLGWESTLSYNLGIDYGILANRISGSIELYKAQTSDVLVSRAIPKSTGYASVWTNIGGISNKGIELTLNTVNIDRSLRWETKFVFSLNRDKITKLYGGAEDRDLGNSWFVGEPISAIYDYKSDYSIWTEEEFYEGKILTPRTYPGHIKFQDLNDDNNLDATNDRTIIGYRTPNFRFSIANDFSYKNFTLSFFLNSVMGGNGYYLEDCGLNSLTTYFKGIGGDAAIQYVYRTNLVLTRQYWTPDNGVTNSPSIYYLPLVNGGFFVDKSFVRLQDISLTYRFSRAVLSTLKIDGLQVYLSGKNLYTWTKWEGWDPEMADFSDSNRDFGRLMRNIIAGVRLTF